VATLAGPEKHLPERKRKLSKAQQTNAAMKKRREHGGVVAGKKKEKEKTIRRHNLLGQQQRMAGGRAIKTKVPTGMSQVERQGKWQVPETRTCVQTV